MTMSSSADGTCVGGTLGEAAKQLEEAGADVVGVNCMSGFNTILPIIKEIRASCKGPVACLPVPYRTTEKERLMIALTDPKTGERCFPDQMDQMLIPRKDIASFVNTLQELGVLYMGLCCGNRAFYTRSMAEALGLKPPASKYSPNMSMHFSTFTDVIHQNATDEFNKNTIATKST